MDLVIWLVCAAIGLVALYFVVRAAVLSALREHHAEVVKAAEPASTSHLDADGL